MLSTLMPILVFSKQKERMKYGSSGELLLELSTYEDLCA